MIVRTSQTKPVKGVPSSRSVVAIRMPAIDCTPRLARTIAPVTCHQPHDPQWLTRGGSACALLDLNTHTHTHTHQPRPPFIKRRTGSAKRMSRMIGTGGGGGGTQSPPPGNGIGSIIKLSMQVPSGGETLTAVASHRHSAMRLQDAWSMPVHIRPKPGSTMTSPPPLWLCCIAAGTSQLLLMQFSQMPSVIPQLCVVWKVHPSDRLTAAGSVHRTSSSWKFVLDTWTSQCAKAPVSRIPGVCDAAIQPECHSPHGKPTFMETNGRKALAMHKSYMNVMESPHS